MGSQPTKTPRKAEAYRFITEYLRERGVSPSTGEIAAALKVGRTRAKTLVHQLALDKMIVRAPGAQRAISVPGLFEQLVIDKLRSEGWQVDEDIRTAAPPCPQGLLSLVAVLDHSP